MRLQKLHHSADDMGEDCTITHIVDEITLGGEFTLCGRAIVDADMKFNGWEPVPSGEYSGTLSDCDCTDCKRILTYYKRLT